MQKRKTKTFALKKTISNSISDAPTLPDFSQSSFFHSKKTLFNSEEEINLSKICFSNRHLQGLDTSHTCRKMVSHLEVAEILTSRFESKNCDDDPFLKAKLNHIMRKWSSKPADQIIVNEKTCSNTEKGSPKFITLRELTRGMARKEAEIKRKTALSLKLH